MRKLGVRSCDESESKGNEKLDRVPLFEQKFGKPKISERLNPNTAIQTARLKSNQVFLRSCRNRF